MSKNIEINYKEDSGYEVLYPTTIPDQVINLLTDSTKTYIGLETSATPDDAFRSLYLLNVLQGKSAVRITLQNQDGIKLKGVTITSSQFVDGKGNKTQSATTNDDGYIDVFSDAETTSVSISGYFEIANTNTSWSTPLGEQHEFTWIVTTRNELTVSSSANYKFTKNVVSFDCCCVGGGGGGGSGQLVDERDPYQAGNGGGGGYVTNTFSIERQEGSYTCTIGSGGAGGPGSGIVGPGDPGSKGGTTLIKNGSNTLSSAEGGEGGGYASDPAAAGNGVGAVSLWDDYKSSPAGNGTVYIFNETERGLAGGGGGGAGNSSGNRGTYYTDGGLPYGGRRADLNSPPNGPGGGGGGSDGVDTDLDSSSGDNVRRGDNGYKGAIYLRWEITA